ncbi:MAG: hypothetical protein EOO24_00455 [Comamonadaceae bacterium]|nr:MAG: hypothetical protein EOO24_00455 [Comamonadaceae bacterium]
MNQVRLLGPAEAGQFPAVFREVFGGDISAAMIDWKYGGERGRQYGVVSEDGRLVAHCGITFRDALVEGRPRRIAQLGDLLGVRHKPGGLARRGSPFGLLIAHVLDHVTTTENPDALTFGFPSITANRLIERLQLGFSLNVINELSFHARPPPAGALRLWLAPRCRRIEPEGGAGFERLVAPLWRAMARDFESGILGLRDAAYLRRRYLSHPEFAYEVYRVSTPWGRTMGLLVCKRSGRELELMDLVAPLHAMPACVRALQSALPSLDADVVKLWLTDRHSERFAPDAAAIAPLQFHQMVNHNSSGGQLERFKGRWWLTSGDTDYR